MNGKRANKFDSIQITKNVKNQQHSKNIQGLSHTDKKLITKWAKSLNRLTKVKEM